MSFKKPIQQVLSSIDVFSQSKSYPIGFAFAFVGFDPVLGAHKEYKLLEEEVVVAPYTATVQASLFIVQVAVTCVQVSNWKRNLERLRFGYKSQGRKTIIRSLLTK